MDRQYNNIIFDFDGTIVDSGPGVLSGAQYALSKFGIEQHPNELKQFMGPPFKYVLATQYDFSYQQCEDGLKYFREYYNEKGIHQNTVYNGISQMLNELKNLGRQLFVASGKPEPFVKEICIELGLYDYFTAIAGSDLAETRTTKSDIILRALELADIKDLSTVLMVGDRKYDIEGANSVGVDSIGILWGGYGTREELVNEGATFIAPLPSDVVRIVCH